MKIADRVAVCVSRPAARTRTYARPTSACATWARSADLTAPWGATPRRDVSRSVRRSRVPFNGSIGRVTLSLRLELLCRACSTARSSNHPPPRALRAFLPSRSSTRPSAPTSLPSTRSAVLRLVLGRLIALDRYMNKLDEKIACRARRALHLHHTSRAITGSSRTGWTFRSHANARPFRSSRTQDEHPLRRASRAAQGAMYSCRVREAQTYVPETRLIFIGWGPRSGSCGASFTTTALEMCCSPAVPTTSTRRALQDRRHLQRSFHRAGILRDRAPRGQAAGCPWSPATSTLQACRTANVSGLLIEPRDPDLLAAASTAHPRPARRVRLARQAPSSARLRLVARQRHSLGSTRGDPRHRRRSGVVGGIALRTVLPPRSTFRFRGGRNVRSRIAPVLVFALFSPPAPRRRSRRRRPFRRRSPRREPAPAARSHSSSTPNRAFDGHRETTFALLHPIAPALHLLYKFDPTT